MVRSLTSRSKPLFGYDADTGDLPPTTPSCRRSNDDNEDDETNPIYRINDHSLPNVEDLKIDTATLSSSRFFHEIFFNNQTTNQDNQCSSSRRRAKILLGLGIGSIVMMIIVSIVLATGRHSSYRNSTTPNNSNNYPSYNNINHSNSVDLDAKRKSIIEFLSVKISYVDDMETQGTPQYNAVEWLLNDDYYGSDIPSDPNDYTLSYQFCQRYILAVVYYALDGPNWDKQCNFLSSSKSVCDWNMVLKKDKQKTDTYGIECSNGGEEITHILLSGNNLKGLLPAEIGDLIALQKLSLFENEINGWIPDRIQALSELWFLQLQGNQFSGAIPSWIGSFATMEYLGLSNNKFNGPIPSEIMNLTNLVEIDLSNNQLTGLIDMFDDDYNNVSHACPAKMKLIYLNNNNLTGRLHDASFRNCGSLQEVDVSTNQLFGYFPGHFYFYRIVNLENNKLAGHIASITISDSPIEFLSLANNQFTGRIPTSIGVLDKLKHLDVSKNNFTGYLSDEFKTMERIEFLFLSDNNFTEGPVPYLADATQLQQLSLAGANRNGTIPSWLGMLSNLVLLDLHANSLTGNIPSQLSELHALSFLLLNRNDLSGEIPTSFTSFIRSNLVFLDNNSFKGSLNFVCTAADASTDDNLLFFSSDCKGDKPEIDCPCCTIRCSDGDTNCNNANDHLEKINHPYSKDHFLYSEDFYLRPIDPSD